MHESQVASGASEGNHSFDRDAGFTASSIETLLMTENGIEVLSTRPRQLTVVGAG